jgi:hypothetical protein
VTVTVGLLPTEDAALLWPETLEAMLEPAVARTSGRMQVEDVLAGIEGGRFGCWVAVNGWDVVGCVIAEKLKYARRKALNVLFIAGHDRDAWAEPMAAALEDFARAQGLDLIEGLGRRGFERVLPGYRVSAIAYEKEITHV